MSASDLKIPSLCLVDHMISSDSWTIRSIDKRLFDMAKEMDIDLEDMSWLDGGISHSEIDPYSCDDDISLLIEAKKHEINIRKYLTPLGSRPGFLKASLNNRTKIQLLIQAKKLGIDIDEDPIWLGGGIRRFGTDPYSCDNISLLIEAKELGIDIHEDVVPIDSEFNSFGFAVNNKNKLLMLIQAKKLGIEIHNESDSDIKYFSWHELFDMAQTMDVNTFDDLMPLSPRKNAQRRFIVDEKDVVSPDSIGHVGEHLVAARLLSYGFKIDHPEIDEGTDIIAKKDGKSFHIQVKTSRQDRYGRYYFKIKKTSFNKHPPCNDFYVLVLLGGPMSDEYLVLPHDVVEKNIRDCNIVDGRSNYIIRCCVDLGSIFIGRNNRVDYYWNHWELIWKLSDFQN